MRLWCDHYKLTKKHEQAIKHEICTRGCPS